ncbi:MAG TPA: hypothetical protein PLE16_02660 [Spirochaetota bacterium]|nr:hypothetical protein [Spirochaetota bacterium]HOH38450.1 hypothetical protein [Spirochaetota bacterium]HPM33486.1 hypothetical protein [Spirochaetota bacterium]
MKRLFSLMLLLMCAGCDSSGSSSNDDDVDIDVTPPSSAVRLIFIHHSCGQNWLADGNGNLRAELNANNYYVSESNYGWDAETEDNLGDSTNTENWPEWFNNTKMPYVYASTYASDSNSSSISNPGGENEIIMFKSCYPLSEVGSGISDEKAYYNTIRDYFENHPDKLFILITPPGESNVSSAALTRQLCSWLIDEENGWLKDYPHKNVGVYDFYCTLSETDSHHRIKNGAVEHFYSSAYDGESPYHDGDDHPNAIANQKAANEFVPLLNYFYNRWKNRK